MTTNKMGIASLYDLDRHGLRIGGRALYPKYRGAGDLLIPLPDLVVDVAPIASRVHVLP